MRIIFLESLFTDLEFRFFYFIFFRNYFWEISCRVSSRTNRIERSGAASQL